MIILVFGIQGSGKSTHALYIANKLKLPYVSTGNILRELEKEQSPLGQQVKALMDSGNIIPDEITIPALEKYLTDNKIENGFVMEGFPRTMEQVNSVKFEIDKIFEFTVPEEVAIARLKQRGRYDDVESAIQTRFAIFKEKTLPVIAYYKEKGVKVFLVSNEGPIVTVQKEIDELLKN